MEHVNIIYKEEIMQTIPVIDHIILILAGLLIIFLLGCLIYILCTPDSKWHHIAENIKKLIIRTAESTLILMVIIASVGNIFFRVPSGRYKYEAVIDKENMTVAEYEEFMNTYNHIKTKNGICYFEDCVR